MSRCVSGLVTGVIRVAEGLLHGISKAERAPDLLGHRPGGVPLVLSGALGQSRWWAWGAPLVT